MRWPCYNCFVDNRCPNPQPKNLLCGGQEGSVGGVQFEQKVSTNTLWHLFAYYILRTLKFQVPTAQASIFGVSVAKWPNFSSGWTFFHSKGLDLQDTPIQERIQGLWTTWSEDDFSKLIDNFAMKREGSEKILMYL